MLHAHTHKDVEYVPGGQARHKLDIYLPPKSGRQPLPLIVWIHGGAWIGGSKDNCRAAPLFAPAGYIVASINYRLVQEAIFPAQVFDCKAAVRWLRVYSPTE